MSGKDNQQISIEEFEKELKNILHTDFEVTYNSYGKDAKSLTISYPSLKMFYQKDTLSASKLNWQDTFTSALRQINKLIETKLPYREITPNEANNLSISDNFNEYEE